MNFANNTKDLTEAVKHLKQLKTLILVGNPMSKESVAKLKAMMPDTTIYFCSN